MSNEMSNKRPRTEDGVGFATMSNSASDGLRNAARIGSLPPALLPALLEHLLAAHPEVQATFDTLYNNAQLFEADRKRRMPPKDFRDLVSECDDEINYKYSDLRPSKQFEIVGDIDSAIFDVVQKIQEGCREDPRIETQVNGLDALAEIAKMMADCDEGEIAKGLSHDISTVTDAIEHIFRGMSEEGKVAQKSKIASLARNLAEYDIYSIDFVDDDDEDNEDDEDE